MRRGDLAVGLLASAGAVAFVSAAIAALKPYVPVLSLGVLYELAVLPVAVLWGLRLATAVSVASMLVFNWFFLPPTHTFQLSDGANWLALAVYLTTGIVVSLLATQARRRAELVAEKSLEAEAVRRSDAMKTAVLHAVSHDLRSPLTAIVAAASGLDAPEVHLAPGDRDELVRTIRTEAERLDGIVGNLLDLSRLRSGVAAPHQELWTADDLVSRALDQLGSRGERVVTILDEDAPPVQVDAAQIERTLVNLLDNALKFSPSHTPVSIRIESRADELRVHVEDGGPGVPAADREAVFEPFRRGDERSRGAGLGLAIARGFAEVNGARVWAENGDGGHFVLALPA
ncbi:MAG: two-component system, OmpR family, sensor histidine kinase KdpD [Gaiellaceae bacterium]|jgi:two-component system sensor histidine kinase KdpD|nr:two-component system, OmpR family, sensor histidine kinase KdpD [Gaiellaceae bacterium]